MAVDVEALTHIMSMMVLVLYLCTYDLSFLNRRSA
jgi:hypothetical protein